MGAHADQLSQRLLKLKKEANQLEVALTQKLLKLKKEMEETKAKRQEFQGELKILMKQLKKLGVETLEKAAELIAKQEKELQELEAIVKSGIRNVETLMMEENNERQNTGAPK